MGVGNFFKKVGTAIKKEIEKSQINSKQNDEIRIVKEKYLSKLSNRELVQIYKAYLGE